MPVTQDPALFRVIPVTFRSTIDDLKAGPLVSPRATLKSFCYHVLADQMYLRTV
jgi:hypothetical protein